MTYNKSLLSGAATIALLASGFANQAFAQVEELPEQTTESRADPIDVITITGSLIKRDSFDDVGSPVTVIDRVDIDIDAPNGKLTDFIKFLPFNNGGTFSTLQGTSQEAETGGGNVDLRGLGAAATLVLLNGRRQTRSPTSLDGRVDINSLVPTILVERAEVLRDGASAVYGTDAVGGVVNFITRDDFQGLEVNLNVRGTTDNWDYADYTAGILAGGDVGADTHVVAAFEYNYRDPLKVTERLELAPLTFAGTSGFPSPPNVFVPSRDANGVLTGATTLTPDPECENVDGSTFLSGNQCRFNFLRQGVFSRKEERFSGMARFTHDFNENLYMTGEIGYAEISAENTGSASLPINSRPSVLGTHPANTFRAVDANGAPLFAQDLDNDGVPDRDSDGVVILSATPTDPASGIAFNEDVILQFRPITDAGGPTAFNAVPQRGNQRTMRQVFAFGGDLADRWFWETGVTRSTSHVVRRRILPLENAVRDGLLGQGGPGGDQFFNPFGSQYFAQPGDPEYNDPQLVAGLTDLENRILDTRLITVDAILTGDLFELPAGPVGVAVGSQYRKERLAVDYDTANTLGLFAFGSRGDRDFDVSQDVFAFFGEALVPLFSGEYGELELSAAVRYEQTDENLDSVDPKISLLYTYADTITLRGSYATSFLAPSLFQRFGSQSSFSFTTDPANPQLGRENITTQLVGNPDLAPQESDSLTFGATLSPFESLSFSVDYWSFDFSNLLDNQGGGSILSNDPFDPRVIRDSNGFIIEIQDPFFNASSLETDGLDFAVNFSQPTDLGEFTFDALGTYITSYDLQAFAGGPIVDGVGRANADNFGAAIPEWRGNFRFGWLNGNQSAHVTVRHIDEVQNDNRTNQDGNQDFAEAETTVDIQYSYDFPDLGVVLTAGAINVFDNLPNPVNDSNGFIDTVQDPIGRQIYLQANIRF